MKIHDIVGIRPKEGVDVGIEIEVEGTNLPEGVQTFWKVVGDGSLRNGLEYVHRSPINVRKVAESLEVLEKAFIEAKAVPDFSFRTSVHVHVNCLTMEYVQVLNYIYTYFLLENILVDFCGEERKGNRFCLRLQDADGSLEYIEKLFASKGREGVFRRIPRDMVRYAALNVEAMPKFGTLEFRSMRGTLDSNIIVPWAETLVHIREYAKVFETPRAIFNRLEEIGERQFFQEAIGKHYPLFDNGQVERSINLGCSLSINLPFVEQRTGALEGKNPRKFYRINGSLVRVSTLIEHFGDEIPKDILEQIAIQDLEEEREREGIPQAAPQRSVGAFRIRMPDVEFGRDIVDDEDEEDDEW